MEFLMIDPTPKKQIRARRLAVPASEKRQSAAAKSVAEAVHMAAVLDARPANREASVATAAYFLAEKRDFAPGHELEDWLAAETQIAERYVRPESPLSTIEPGVRHERG
jgi:hypothetical protein